MKYFVGILLTVSSLVAQAAFTIFTDRASWESAAGNRGLVFAQEDFNAFAPAPGIPEFYVGSVTISPGPDSGAVSGGTLVPIAGGGVRFGPQPAASAGTISGDYYGFGMYVTDASGTRSMDLFDASGNSFFATPPSATAGDRFIGVLFDTPAEAAGVRFGASTLQYADNLVVAMSAASVSEVLSHQGYLEDANGPVNGTVAIVFSLYASPTSGTRLWKQSQSVAVVNGLYSTELGGPSAPLSTGLFSQTLWLGINVNGNGEMRPRQALTRVPYAFHSKEADRVAAGAVGVGQLAADARLSLNPIARDANGEVLGAVMGFDALTVTVLSPQGYFTRIDRMTGSHLDRPPIYFESTDCSGQGYIRDANAYLLGSVYITSSNQFSYTPAAESSVDIMAASTRANILCTPLVNVTRYTSYKAYANDPAVTGISNTLPRPRPIGVEFP